MDLRARHNTAQSFNVLILLNSLSGGGAESAMVALGNLLVENGFAVKIVGINSGPHFELNSVGTSITLNKRGKSLLRLVKSHFLLSRCVSDFRPDIVILNCSLPELMGCFMINSGKTIVVEHAPFPWGKRKILGQIVRCALSMKRSRWVSVSENSSVWGLPNIRASYIPNLLPLRKEKSQHEVNEEINELMYVGRLSEVAKRPDWLIHISEKVKIPVSFVGEGDLYNHLQFLSKSKKVEARFKGWLDDPWDDVSPNTILVVPSDWEGDGLVVIEAISAGIPILMSDIPAFRKFNLPERHYCKSILDFSSRIEEFRTQLSQLRVAKSQVVKIQAKRDSTLILKMWLNEFNSQGS